MSTYDDDTLLSCPAKARAVPSVQGVRKVGSEWQLSVAVHRELIRDITGIEPMGDLDLQDLATITARLEGYVERQRRRQEQFEPETDHPDSDASRAIVTPLLWLRRQFRALLSGVGLVTIPEPAAADSESVDPQYPVETVYELSRFFRAATEARRTAIDASTANPPAKAPDS